MSAQWRDVGAVLDELERRVPEPWQVSPWPGPLMAVDEVAGEVSLYSPQAVSIDPVQSSWTGGDRGEIRRRTRNALHTTTDVDVRWLYAIQTDDGSVPYRRALEAERDLIARLITPTGQPVRAVVTQATRRVTPQGWVDGRIRVTVTHEMPLTPAGG